MSSPPTTLAHVQRRTVATLSAAQVVGGLGAGAALSLGVLLVRDVSGSSAVAGLTTTATTLGAALFAIPLARLADGRGRRPALALGWALAALGCAAVVAGATVASAPLVLAGLLVVGANTATTLQSRYAAADLAAPAQVGRSLSLVVWSTTIGTVVGPNLSPAGGALARALGLPALSGAFVIAAGGFLLASALMAVALVPDPLLTARQSLTARAASTPVPLVRSQGSLRRARAVLATSTPARTAVITLACAHALMVAVMAMTPVHLADHGASLQIIGLTISLHVAGMFALSPVMGVLADRWGSSRTIVLGQATLLAATLVAGTAHGSSGRMMIGLTLLGLGWSASTIAGSSLLTASLDPDQRPALQGASDLAMNLAGAVGGLVAGVVVNLWGFGPLNVVAAFLTVPVIRLVLGGRHRVQPAGRLAP